MTTTVKSLVSESDEKYLVIQARPNGDYIHIQILTATSTPDNISTSLKRPYGYALDIKDDTLFVLLQELISHG